MGSETENWCKRFFWEEDWNHILSIPIKFGMDDILAWHFDSKGVFSVKSAYRILDDDRARNASWQKGEGSTIVGRAVNANFRWKNLWRLNCPLKVKHFFWRFTLNSLPVRRNINIRGMEIDTRCPVCLRLDEDGGHCFLKCKYAKQCWRALGLEEEREMLCKCSSSMQVSENIMSMQESKRILIIGLLWSWWDARNKVNAGEERRSIDEIIYRAQLVTQNVQELPTNAKSINARERDQRWVPPGHDVWKINVDAAFSEKDLGGAWGFVVRDHHSRAVLAGAGRIAVVSDALCAEAHACIEALMVAANQGMQHVMVETDSQILVKALQTDEFDRARGVCYSEKRSS